MKKVNVLLAEDDPNLGIILKEFIEAKGYAVQLATDGNKAYAAFMKSPFDLCVLDIMMPFKDGFTLAKEIRSINSSIPIIFLTAKSMKEDVLEGFRIGADDYMIKPFSMEELLFRIEAILKRMWTNTEKDTKKTIFEIGKYTFDYKKGRLSKGKQVRKLTSKESELLRLLCVNVNTTLDRNFALKTIWDDDSVFNVRSMDVFISKLRKYLKDDPSVEIINVYSKGFKLLINR